MSSSDESESEDVGSKSIVVDRLRRSGRDLREAAGLTSIECLVDGFGRSEEALGWAGREVVK